MATNLPLGRARLQSDPLRNFKFQVSIDGNFQPNVQASVNDMGFTSVEGLNMSTEMIPYREGGWNTNPHKMPGLTDFSPVTMSSGMFYNRPGMWDLAKQMFAVQWGNGSISLNDDYRFDMVVRVYDHPVTNNSNGGALTPHDISKPMVAFKLWNAWVANVQFSGLNAMENSILVHQMTVHHEGLGVWFNTGRDKTGEPASF